MGRTSAQRPPTQAKVPLGCKRPATDRICCLGIGKKQPTGTSKAPLLSKTKKGWLWVKGWWLWKRSLHGLGRERNTAQAVQKGAHPLVSSCNSKRPFDLRDSIRMMIQQTTSNKPPTSLQFDSWPSQGLPRPSLNVWICFTNDVRAPLFFAPANHPAWRILHQRCKLSSGSRS